MTEFQVLVSVLQVSRLGVRGLQHLKRLVFFFLGGGGWGVMASVCSLRHPLARALRPGLESLHQVQDRFHVDSGKPVKVKRPPAPGTG